MLFDKKPNKLDWCRSFLHCRSLQQGLATAPTTDLEGWRQADLSFQISSTDQRKAGAGKWSDLLRWPSDAGGVVARDGASRRFLVTGSGRHFVFVSEKADPSIRQRLWSVASVVACRTSRRSPRSDFQLLAEAVAAELRAYLQDALQGLLRRVAVEADGSRWGYLGSWMITGPCWVGLLVQQLYGHSVRTCFRSAWSWLLLMK